MSLRFPKSITTVLLATIACGGGAGDDGSGTGTNDGMECLKSADADETPAADRFVDNQDGTVCDTMTGFTWQQLVLDTPSTWDEANEHCEELELPGNNWHVPTFDELDSIVQDELRPAIDSTAFPDAPGKPFWTSTPFDPEADDEVYAIDFGDGSGGTSLKENRMLLVRCAR